MKTQITCYRIEGKDKIGMFRSTKTQKIQDNTCIIERHKYFNNPEDDGLQVRRHGVAWKCAYKTLGSLKKLNAKRDIQFVISLGFKVFKIKASEFQEGKDQFVFTERGIIEKIDITNQFI